MCDIVYSYSGSSDFDLTAGVIDDNDQYIGRDKIEVTCYHTERVSEGLVSTRSLVTLCGEATVITRQSWIHVRDGCS